jgi:hypothetical protein
MATQGPEVRAGQGAGAQMPVESLTLADLFALREKWLRDGSVVPEPCGAYL